MNYLNIISFFHIYQLDIDSNQFLAYCDMIDGGYTEFAKRVLGGDDSTDPNYFAKNWEEYAKGFYLSIII